MTTGTPLVEARAVTKHFGGVVALDGVTLGFHGGEVHCVAGENGCGKSTLMKIVSGAHRPTGGDLLVDGEVQVRHTPRRAFELGLDVIYQDFSLLPNLSVAENIMLPTLVARGRRRYPRREVRATAEAAVARLGTRLPLDRAVGDLTVAERQLCAVARALAHDARFIAMDEPTTALTWREVDALFEVVATLRSRGVAVVFISHKLHEVFAISDRVSVMRNGRIVTAGRPGDFTHATLAEAMTGRSVTTRSRDVRSVDRNPPALSVRGLTRRPLYADVSFDVAQGEVVGLAGLLGSGRTEIAEGVVGIRPAVTGEVRVMGRAVAVRCLADAMRAGIGYVPEDRLTQGLFADQPIADNLAVSTLPAYAGRGLLHPGRLRRAVEDVVRDLRIRVRSVHDPVRVLSGGNAQRVLLGRWLMRDPHVLVLNGPTVGVDVGSKFDILAVLTARSLQGLAVLVISDDVPELTAMCHRVLIVRHGRLESELAGDLLTEAALVRAIAA
jgi:simple sugar transport system ATP-binding protein